MRKPAVLLVLAAAITAFYWIAQAGDLEPQAPPGPTMKTLVEVEPRTAITETNTPGDTGAVAVISQPGSYYLTGDLAQVGNENGIRVAADNVTIDLNGFSLVGQGAAGASSFAIGTEAPHPKNTTVRNGSVINWSASGVMLGGIASLVDSVRVQGARGNGIFIANGIIRNCTVIDSVDGSGSAIYAQDDSLIVGCTATGNFSNGIQVGTRSLVTECSSSSNGEDGIYLGHGDQNRIVGNNVANNARNGIWADSDCTHNLIADNHATGNDVGIRVDGTAIDNVIVKNTAGQNVTQNYLIVGNDAGPVQQAATATSAWANIEAP